MQDILFLEIECTGIYANSVGWLEIAISNIISNKLENMCLSESLVVEVVRPENGLIKIERDWGEAQIWLFHR